jgi:hypothetical protein
MVRTARVATLTTCDVLFVRVVLMHVTLIAIMALRHGAGCTLQDSAAPVIP